MDKRLAKRHKRQVSREKVKVNLSQPDLRTPEQLRAAREASRPEGLKRNEPQLLYSSRTRDRVGVVAGAIVKAEG